MADVKIGVVITLGYSLTFESVPSSTSMTTMAVGTRLRI